MVEMGERGDEDEETNSSHQNYPWWCVHVLCEMVSMHLCLCVCVCVCVCVSVHEYDYTVKWALFFLVICDGDVVR